MGIYTVVYLIRHSEKINPNIIDHSKNTEKYQIRREKIILGIEGEEKAKKLSENPEFKNVNCIYSSSYSRTIQTAKYLAQKNNLIINVDNRFNERCLGIRGDEDIAIKQYYDENIKNEEGESKKEVTKRMTDAFWDTVNENKGKNIAIFTHACSMTFLLMNWCKLEYITEDKQKCLSFNGKIIVDKIFSQPEIFKLIIDDDKVISIENIR